MVHNPKDYFEDAKKAGFSYVIVPFEAFENSAEIDATIKKAKDLGLKIGQFINSSGMQNPTHKPQSGLQDCEPYFLGGRLLRELCIG